MKFVSTEFRKKFLVAEILVSTVEFVMLCTRYLWLGYMIFHLQPRASSREDAGSRLENLYPPWVSRHGIIIIISGDNKNNNNNFIYI